MKFIIFTLFLSSIIARGQTQPDTNFVVALVEAHGTYDTTYVLELARTLMTQNKAITLLDVKCFKDELEASGLFDKVELRWQNRTGEARRLNVYSTSRAHREQLTISKFSLIGLRDIDENEFLKRMGEKGIFTGAPLELDYEHLNEMVDESIRQSVPAAVVTKYSGSAWVVYRRSGPASIEIKVFPEFPACVEAKRVN